MHLPWWLIPIGFVLGAFGTLIGAGGGFLLVPFLLLAYPTERPEILTSISLAVVFFNAASGSWAYARMGRIDFVAAAVFAAAALPGVIAGALLTSLIPGRLFDGMLGTLMLLVGLYLFMERSAAEGDHEGDSSGAPRQPGMARRTVLWLGAAISAAIGFVASLLGIGGGIIHVPALSRVLKFPVHVATATSHLILAIMALIATVTHLATGSFSHGWRRTTMLAIGVVVGAQLGAHWSSRVRGPKIIAALAIALVLVALRLLLVAWSGVRL